MPITKNMYASDMNNTIISNVNSMVSTYGFASPTANVVTGNKMLASTLQSLYTNLDQCNNHVNNSVKVSLTDITSINVGDLIDTTMLNLIESKAVSIKSTYCSCNCNYCSCNCNQCSCDCDRCSCNCNRCSCNCNNCSCNSNIDNCRSYS